jgi:hypothetical protein
VLDVSNCSSILGQTWANLLGGLPNELGVVSCGIVCRVSADLQPKPLHTLPQHIWKIVACLQPTAHGPLPVRLLKRDPTTACLLHSHGLRSTLQLADNAACCHAATCTCNAGPACQHTQALAGTMTAVHSQDVTRKAHWALWVLQN